LSLSTLVDEVCSMSVMYFTKYESRGNIWD